MDYFYRTRSHKSQLLALSLCVFIEIPGNYLNAAGKIQAGFTPARCAVLPVAMNVSLRNLSVPIVLNPIPDNRELGLNNSPGDIAIGNLDDSVRIYSQTGALSDDTGVLLRDIPPGKAGNTVRVAMNTLAGLAVHTLDLGSGAERRLNRAYDRAEADRRAVVAVDVQAAGQNAESAVYKKSPNDSDDIAQGTFREVPNPNFKWITDEMEPPNLKREHVDKLLDALSKAAEAKFELSGLEPNIDVPRTELNRLVYMLTTIDKHYVDEILPSAWEKAVEAMGEAATNAFDAVTRNWSDTITAMIKAAVSKLLDPYSFYWTPDEFKAFQEQLSDTFVGIGVVLRQDGSIKYVFPGNPAANAGLRSRDRIVSVDGENASGMGQIGALLRGKKGTSVRVRVERSGEILPDFTIVREAAHRRNIYSKMTAPNVGYIHLARFSKKSEREVFAAINDLRKQGATKLILDVRGNLGGLLESVSLILASFFKDGQRIVSFKRRGQVVSEHIADGAGRFADMPVMVLVDENSASASELLAGALQDVRGPIVVGSRSYGKGSAQFEKRGQEGNVLNLTIFRWFTPAGRNIDGRPDPRTKERIKDTGGIVPDYAVPLSEQEEIQILMQLYKEMQGLPLDGPRVADPVLEKALQVLQGPGA